MKEVKYEQRRKKVTKLSDIDFSLTYSYSHYLSWLFDDRVELFKGKVHPMSAPARLHQEVSGALFVALSVFLKGQSCKVYTAPFDVRLATGSKADKAVYTVVQPDICVVCASDKLDTRGCIGAPDLVVEVLSPGNTKKELFDKFKLYEEFGVREYWIINPGNKEFLGYTLQHENVYVLTQHLVNAGMISSLLLPGFRLNLNELFT